MSDSIIGLYDWLQTPAGQYLLTWERARVDAAVADIFGYHALQLGLPQLDGLHTNRMPHQWLALDQMEPINPGSARQVALLTDFGALPFPSSSLDLVVLLHTLEHSANPHAALREVERVLVPEGRVVICGMNPVSLWGLQQRCARVCQLLGRGGLSLPEGQSAIRYGRLRDWLHLLSFEVEQGEFGCYRPVLRSGKWLQRFNWMDKVGARWWPILGAAYFLVAIKRVRGMRLMGPSWKAQPARVSKPVSVANSVTDYSNGENKIE
jgi:SAM-dependent methyltransferase